MTEPILSRVPLEPEAPPASLNGDVLRVVPLSDLHITAHPPSTEVIVSNRAYFDKMDYAVLLGDMVACYGTDREYDAVADFVRRLGRPYTAVSGNHEFYFEIHYEQSGQYGRVWNEQSPELKSAQLDKFQRFYGLPQLWRAHHCDFGTMIFLGLDDIHSTKQESLSLAQQEFLLETLQEAANRPVYVFCHVPLLIRNRLDMVYYDTERTACFEPAAELRRLLELRNVPLFWMSGHIHLRPDHYLFEAYPIARQVWQVHCPDSWGFSRWTREHRVPQRHEQLFSRHLEIAHDRLTLVTHDHYRQADIGRQTLDFAMLTSAI